MKNFLAAVLLILFVVAASRADESNLTLTVDGVTYSNVTFGTVTSTSVKIFHSSGIARIPLKSLPPDIQKRLGYDPEKTKAETARAKAEAEAARANAKAKAEADAIRAMTEAEESRAKANKAKNIPVEGARDFSVDVFVRMKGGESIKCGLVAIRVFDEKAIDSWLPEITKNLADQAFDSDIEFLNVYAKKQKAERAEQLAKNAYEIAQQNNEAAFKKWTAEVRNLLPAKTRYMSDANIEDWYDKDDDIKNAAPAAKTTVHRTYVVETEKQAESDSAVAASRSVDEECRKADSVYWHWHNIVSDALIASLPEPVLTVKTDADGRCVGQMPKPGWYAFCADFSRLVGDVSERDTWLIWVNLDDPSHKKIMLSNDNTLPSFGPDNVLQIIPTPHKPPDSH